MEGPFYSTSTSGKTTYNGPKELFCLHFRPLALDLSDSLDVFKAFIVNSFGDWKVLP